jgi:hypothetical protein
VTKEPQDEPTARALLLEAVALHAAHAAKRYIEQQRPGTTPDLSRLQPILTRRLTDTLNPAIEEAAVMGAWTGNHAAFQQFKNEIAFCGIWAAQEYLADNHEPSPQEEML